MIDNNVLFSLRNRGEEIKEDIITWRRSLHKIPELRMETVKTEKEIVEILKKIGIDDISAGVGGHGVCAVIKGAYQGKCLAIRADCDGLPIKEETGLSFASENGNMHACGHDAHTAMALGAAKLIYEHRHKLKGCVKLIFQPFEEGDGGAKLMIADSVLENPKVDAIVALHNYCDPDEDYILGDVLVTDMPITANIYAYEAVFKGTCSHICMANTAKNSVYMACTAVSEIAKLQKSDSKAINAVSMVHGGVRNNIIPDTCTICGSIRAFDKDEHNFIKEQVLNILKYSANMYGGSVEIKTTIDLMSTEIDFDLYSKFCKTVNTVYPERECVTLKDRDLIGEDFARFANIVPGLYFKLYTKPDEKCYPLHHPKFDVNESVLHKGSILFSSFAFTWQD